MKKAYVVIFFSLLGIWTVAMAINYGLLYFVFNVLKAKLIIYGFYLILLFNSIISITKLNFVDQAEKINKLGAFNAFSIITFKESILLLNVIFAWAYNYHFLAIITLSVVVFSFIQYLLMFFKAFNVIKSMS